MQLLFAERSLFERSLLFFLHVRNDVRTMFLRNGHKSFVDLFVAHNHVIGLIGETIEDTTNVRGYTLNVWL
jgi:hypothetical protein